MEPVTTTPARDCPDHNDPIECTCQAARGQAAARRERYKTALARVLLDSAGRIVPKHIAETAQAVSDSTDAVMALADQEQQETVEGCVRFTAAVRAENARLRKEAAEVRAAAHTAAAADLEARCPKHGNGETTFADCLCAAAHELRRLAAAARPDNTEGA